MCAAGNRSVDKFHVITGNNIEKLAVEKKLSGTKSLQNHLLNNSDGGGQQVWGEEYLTYEGNCWKD